MVFAEVDFLISQNPFKKLGGGLIFIDLEHMVVQLWLLTLYFIVSMFALAKMPTVTKNDA